MGFGKFLPLDEQNENNVKQADKSIQGNQRVLKGVGHFAASSLGFSRMNKIQTFQIHDSVTKGEEIFFPGFSLFLSVLVKAHVFHLYQSRKPAMDWSSHVNAMLLL